MVLKSYFYDRMCGLQVIPRFTIWGNIWEGPFETFVLGVMHPSSPLASSRHRFRPALSPRKQAHGFSDAAEWVSSAVALARSCMLGRSPVNRSAQPRASFLGCLQQRHWHRAGS